MATPTLTPPGRSGLKGTLLNWLEARGYVLLNTRKLATRNTWLNHLAVSTVLDVGANTGESALELHAMYPKAQVVSFEPLPDSFAAMQQRLAGHAWSHRHNLALAEKTGRMTMHRSAYALSSSLLPMSDAHKQAYPYSAGSQPVEVEISTLDAICAPLQGPFLIKLDVQGYEYGVLQGAAETLTRTAALIVETSFVELYEGQKLFNQVQALLNRAGFAYTGSWAQRNSPVNGQPLQQDAVFVRQG